MSDIEVDSFQPGSGHGWQNYSNDVLQRLSPSPMQFSSSTPYTIAGGISRENFAISGDISRQIGQPSDSSYSNYRTTDRRTRSDQSVYGNSVNNVIRPNQQISSNHTNNSFISNNVTDSYNFSHSHSNDSASTNNSLNNTSTSTNSRVPDISQLSMNDTDSSFVFNRPPSESNPTMQRKIAELQNSKYPNYRTMAQRMQSYASTMAPVRSAQDMSEAGFFAIRNQDFVRCFHCGIGLRNWEEDDDPYVEHCRWSPQCQYMKIKKGEAFIEAVQEAVRKVQLEEALGESETRDMAQGPGAITYQDLAEDGDNSESYPAHVLKKNPLLTNAAQSVVEMGYLPRVVKKAIDTLLENHGLHELTGQLIANLIMDMESKGEKVMKPVHQATPSVDKSTVSPDAKRKLEEQNREYKEKISCVICCEAERSITFLPCGHLVCCAQCAPACSTCAVCRKDIKGTVKISLR